MIISEKKHCSDPHGAVKQKGSVRLVCVLCGILASILLALTLVTWSPGVAEARRCSDIKFATLAPEGSSWMKQMRQLDQAVQKKTGGKVCFKFYPGGVAGDEADVIRKMRIGQMHAAGFTGVGLGEILPEVRVLDLPFLFRDDREISHVYEKMTDYFAGRFEEKGYVLLGWVPVGWVHFFSQEKIQTLADLQQTKAWMWQGDPLVEAAYKGLGVNPHPLSVTDVMMALQTGMVNTVYASPVGALALQWFTKVKYMSQIRMGNATGAVLMSKRQFSKIPDEYKAVVKETSAESLKVLVKTIQGENQQAIEVMLQNGLELAPLPDQKEIDRFHQAGEKARKDLTGKMFGQEVLDQVLSHLGEVR